MNLKKKSTKKRFLFIGRLSTEKNLKLLIEIFNTLPNHTLTLIGTGIQEKELKSIANENIVFVGQVENGYLQEYFKNSDIFILPSIAETWGLVVEKALYFGLPVMVSQNCGASELIEDAQSGYILDVKDLESMKNIIIEIDDEKYQRLLDGVAKYSICEKYRGQAGAYEL